MPPSLMSFLHLVMSYKRSLFTAIPLKMHETKVSAGEQTKRSLTRTILADNVQGVVVHTANWTFSLVETMLRRNSFSMVESLSMSNST